MAPLPPGTRADILADVLWWAPVGSVIAGLDRPYGDDLSDLDYQLIDDTENGIVVASRITTTPYRSEERGQIATLLGDDIGVSIGFTDLTPTWELAMQLSQFEKVTQAAGAGGAGSPAAEFYHQNAQATGWEVMIVFDGRARPGGVFPDNTLIRGVGYACSQTAATAHNFRHRGNDSPFRIVAALECTPYPVQPVQLVGSQILAASLDPDGKFDYITLAAA